MVVQQKPLVQQMFVRESCLSLIGKCVFGKMIVQQFCLFKNVFAPTTICSNNVLRVARVARKVVARDEQPMVMGHAGVISCEMYRISFAYRDATGVNSRP